MFSAISRSVEPGYGNARVAALEALEARQLLSIALPVIPAAVFNVTNYGAIADGTTDSTAAIQTAINAASTAGGGTVEIPAASQPYECGPIALKNSINFQVDSGAKLQMLAFNRYPTPSGTSDYADFIAAENLHDVEISGAGTIDGQGSAWWTAYSAGTLVNRRPGMIDVSNGTRVLIQDLTLINPANTHMALNYANNNVTIQRVTVNTANGTPNTDGLDLTGANVLIDRCSFSCGDDNIAFGGRSSTNITVSNCFFGTGHGLSIGSYTGDGLNGLTVTNCSFNGTLNGIHGKSARDRGGLVTNLSYSGITMTNVTNPIVFDDYYTGTHPTDPSADPAQAVTSTTPYWTNITINNLSATNCGTGGSFWGLPEAPISNVSLNNVQITLGNSTAKNALKFYHVKNVTWSGSSYVKFASGTSALLGYDQTVTPAGWTDADLGAATSAGAGTSLFDPRTSTWTISGSGADIYTTTDQGNYAYQTIDGNAAIVAKVVSQTNTSSAAKAGVLIRASTSATAIFADVVATPGKGVQFQYRLSDGATAKSANSVSTTIVAPLFTKLIRSGNNISAYYSADGTTWTQVGTTQTIVFPSSALFGLAVTSHSTTDASIAVFTNVAITPAPVVTASAYPWQTAANQLTFTFSGNVSASLDVNDLTVSSDSGSTITPVSVSYNSTTNTATFTALTLPDANYTATLSAAGISDSVGNALAADTSLGFFVLSGDVNHDRGVNIADLGILATGYGSQSATFAQGDLNRDGKVDIADLGILATNYGRSLGTPQTAIQPMAVEKLSSAQSARVDSIADQVLR